MEFSGVLVLFLRGLMAVGLVSFTVFALSILWKDMRHEKDTKKKPRSSLKQKENKQ
ncbi:MAG TPA: hypothetical protein PLL88_03225 [Anaerolineaceae bacterium]|jgi:hypothetical protein|nr:hypothetical protein [Anaerolineaceae bacterium]